MIIIAYWFFQSPLATAAAEAIRHANGVPVKGAVSDQTVDQLVEELNALRENVTELAERVDFTERALADVRRREQLPPRV
ncbi:MAG: hypothetical protein EXR93_02940 [Gemmatimonadetes bacterium]|nr:hypothetical protein [Gemmatimonadota bacterium]